jgi:hypothetical protein
MKCIYKCDDFTARSSMTMADYILSQCSPEDIITAWYNVGEGTPSLYCDDVIIGRFSLGDLLTMYRNGILKTEMHDRAFDVVEDWLRDEMELSVRCSMPMLDISVNINNFHIRITQEV